MIKNVLLDVDDTLLDFKKAEAVAVARALNEAGIDATDEIIAHYSDINDKQWARLERKEISREQVLYGRFEILFNDLGLSKSSAEVQERYEYLLGIGHYFIDGAPELLEALYGKYRLYIVSNGTLSVQRGRIGSAGIAKYFEKIFISQQLGAEKPSTEFFDRCFEQMQPFEKNETIIVGDRLSSDILGGINAGIKTCWFNAAHLPENESIPADYEIDKLSQLPALLESIE